MELYVFWKRHSIKMPALRAFPSDLPNLQAERRANNCSVILFEPF